MTDLPLILFALDAERGVRASFHFAVLAFESIVPNPP